MDDSTPQKKAVLRKALRLAVVIFFLSMGLFVLIVILVAKFATKASPR